MRIISFSDSENIDAMVVVIISWRQQWLSLLHSFIQQAWTQALRSSSPARSVSEIRDGEYLRQWYRLEIRLNTFRQSTISQKKTIQRGKKTQRNKGRKEETTRAPALPRFILLVNFSDTLLVISILDIVYDCHLRPLLQS